MAKRLGGIFLGIDLHDHPAIGIQPGEVLVEIPKRTQPQPLVLRRRNIDVVELPVGRSMPARYTRLPAWPLRGQTAR